MFSGYTVNLKIFNLKFFSFGKCINMQSQFLTLYLFLSLSVVET